MMLRALVLLCLLAAPAQAARINVLSGEHEALTRLVFMVPPNAQWEIEETNRGFRLATDAPDPQFQMQDVFRRIPRDRVLDLETGVDPGTVLIRTAKGVRYSAFALAGGGVVVDFYSDQIRPQPRPAALERSARTAASPVPSAAASEAPTERVTRQPVKIGEQHLDLYWAERSAPDPSPANDPIAPPQDAPLALPEIAQTDSRVAAVQSNLIKQLGRAASQGLIELELPELPTRPDRDPGKEVQALVAEPTETSHLPRDHIAFKSETSVDQAEHLRNAGSQTTKTGLRCAPDALFAVGSWRGESDVSTQIGDGRRALLGEFDRPDQVQVLQLARTFLAFGFGAEARALLRELATEDPARDSLFYLSDILDERPESRTARFAQMTSCDGDVALWAVLGADPLPEKDQVNFAAVQRAYFALSPELRHTVGPDLVARLIAMGASDVAYALRPALSRVSQDDKAALEMVDAQIELDEGAPDAEPALRSVVAEDGPHAAQALLLLVDARLAAGQPIDEATMQNARSLAFELQGTPIGRRLLRAAALGHASIGAFDEGYGLLADWPADAEEDLRAQTLSEITMLLGKLPEDDGFTRAFFAHREAAIAAGADPEVRATLAERLTALGFAASAKTLLTRAEALNDTDRFLLAQVALQENDAAAALTYLEGLEGAEVTAMRASAMSRIGDHAAALNYFANAGEAERATREAWRDGNWEYVKQHGSAPEKAFVATFAADADTAEAAPPPAGPLERAESLIAASRKERELLADVLNALGPTQVAAPSEGMVGNEIAANQ
ncbi:hypothetical protein DL1_02510 [Thioclava dalianensis]|uniref:Uncharacterized protein n=1 Tax=Thioclava dalianensis TaxID=1185766 RepID=A0A074TDC6_9RHOB|nr:hypothetical protein [Thioclava dalianensis]KEP69761.1 hypothetical protein DL1_02510 [Thioclava dalianensis]SFM93213.1 hypothetical protein SAMN05216224_101997 [Thioclava dalianensis]